MSFLGDWLRHPRRLWLRRVNFQLHLWIGVVLALYVTVIGVSGSILVFGLELGRLVDSDPWSQVIFKPPIADLSVVVRNLRKNYPGLRLLSVMAPSPNDPVFTATLQRERRITVACHPNTGQVLGELEPNASHLGWIYDLHENLLARRSGRIVNGTGAVLLLLMAMSGLINWWPGVQSWRRALSVDFRRSWKRINFDLHSAAGFWCLSFILLWAVTGIYFAWPAKFCALVDRVSPLVNSQPPVVTIDPNSDKAPLDFYTMLAKAHQVDPNTQWKGVVLPGGPRSPLLMLMSRSPGIGRDHEDTVYFNPYNAKYISMWQYGVNRSPGDWIIWLAIPLHFGTHWGLPIKILWASIGLSLPLLAMTGLIMYWNRVLAKKWSQLQRPATLKPLG